ncbi:hypothetical protein [Kitasatospora sp. McL0602]|uniref:hypothetical protein n=1 Tax=Kitasatospora sp. McL0602 TaxID=3439530 RepID=UPI003F8B0FDE
MRTLLQIEMDTEASNKKITDGTLPAFMQSTLGELKPEAAYFFAKDGHRSALLVFDLADPSSIVPSLEPLWLELNAKISLTPCMNADELAAGLAKLGS